MIDIRKLREDVTLFKAKDPNLRVFDIVMSTKYGTTYNSYILDGGDEIALIETAKEEYFDEYFRALSENFDINKIKYLVVNHTEPDHTGEVHKLLEKMPWLKIVGTPSALCFLKDISNKNFAQIQVREGDSLQVGNKTLKFIIAPNLHWPDSMFTYCEQEKFLFSCDVFGAHYCTDCTFVDEVGNEKDYLDSFKYYYDCIFGPFKDYVKSGIKQLENLGISPSMICPSHGPVIRKGFRWYLDKYLNWAEVKEVDSKKITIAYVSAYGYSKRLAEEIAKGVESQGFNTVLCDLLEKSTSEVVEEIETSYAFLIGSPTLNADTLPNVWDLLLRLNFYNLGGKLAGAFGAYGWSGEAVRNIESRFSQIRCEVFRPGLKIKFNPNEESKLKQAFTFGERFGTKAKSLQNNVKEEWCQLRTGLWRCLICGEVYEGEEPPESCPACGAPSGQFVCVNKKEVEFRKDTEETFVVVGGGIAAVSAIESIRERNKTCRILMISEEKSLPYFRILLSKKLGLQRDVEPVKEQKWFEDNGVELMLDKKAFRILEKEKQVLFSDGSRIAFDKVLIATGARANKIPVHGDDKNGCFHIRGQKDFEGVFDYLSKKDVKKAVVVGGGILGVEMATSLKNSGVDVEIVEFAPRVMIRQLDVEGSEIFSKFLSEKGIGVRCNEVLDEIFGTGLGYKDVCGVQLKHAQEKIDCDMVLFATGIKSNVEVVQDSDILVNRGIVVDKFMKTNVDDVYCVGDCAEFNQKVIGLWSIAIEQGKVAGAQMCGDTSEYYVEMPIAVSFNSLNYSVFSLGDLGIEKDKDKYQVLEMADKQIDVYRKFYFYNNEFVGGILMGNVDKATQLQLALKKGSTMSHFLDMHFLD